LNELLWNRHRFVYVNIDMLVSWFRLKQHIRKIEWAFVKRYRFVYVKIDTLVLWFRFLSFHWICLVLAYRLLTIFFYLQYNINLLH
jgi:hypothetical protein